MGRYDGRRIPERRGTEAVITAPTRNRLRALRPTWVRIPPSPPVSPPLHWFMADPPAQQSAETAPRLRETSLLRWVWRSYVRNALIPLLVVELLLVAVYLTSHAWSLRKNVAALTEVARQELSRIAVDESAVIEQQLGQVAALTDVLRRQTLAALESPAKGRPDRARLHEQPSGALTTHRDDGGAAVFYSAATAEGSRANSTGWSASRRSTDSCVTSRSPIRSSCRPTSTPTIR